MELLEQPVLSKSERLADGCYGHRSSQTEQPAIYNRGPDVLQELSVPCSTQRSLKQAKWRQKSVKTPTKALRARWGMIASWSGRSDIQEKRFRGSLTLTSSNFLWSESFLDCRNIRGATRRSRSGLNIGVIQCRTWEMDGIVELKVRY
jgi:hypothetical protein